MTALSFRFAGPILFRDGRPYATETPANSLAWPWPSTLYGALRAHVGRNEPAAWQAMLAGQDEFGDEVSRVVGTRAALGSLHMRGPLLRVVDPSTGRPTLAVPAPGDCEVFQAGRKKTLVVAAQPVGGETLPVQLDAAEAPLLWMSAECPGGTLRKPVTQRYPWWPWLLFEDWLSKRAASSAVANWATPRRSRFPLRVQPAPYAVDLERRIHVHITRGFGRLGVPLPVRTAEEGQLYAAERLSLSERLEAELIAWVDGDEGRCAPGLLTLGGERGLAFLDTPQESLPSIPSAVLDQACADGSFSLHFLTPALFARGWIPAFLKECQGSIVGELAAGDTSLAVRLVAACVGRPLPVSGFALTAGGHGQERPARRAVPAGSVYFFKTQRDEDKARLDGLLRALWWRNLSDAAEDRATGFGLAAVGVGLGAAVPAPRVG